MTKNVGSLSEGVYTHLHCHHQYDSVLKALLNSYWEEKKKKEKKETEGEERNNCMKFCCFTF